MDERPFPHGPLPQPPPSRRGFVIAGVVTLAAAGGGVALGLATGGHSTGTLPFQVSHELTAAADAERALLAQVDAALRGTNGSRRALLREVRADHVAHLRAITASIADARYPDTSSPSPSPSPSSSSTPVVGRVRVADVRAGEQSAARAAAARATRLTGRSAVLFASIAAAEASHAELLR